MHKTTSPATIVKLESVCHSITDGKHGDCENEEGSGYYFLSAKDVRDGKLQYDGARQITETDFLETHKRTRLEPLDILISNSGTIGRIALAQDVPLTRRTTFQKSVAIVKPNKEYVYPHYLLYYFLSARDRLISAAGGTAQVNLLLRDLRAFEVAIYPLDLQKQIASILSAYDDLIENNTRRIKVLEQMAQALYREWFVEFRAPDVKLRKATPEEAEVTRKEQAPQGWNLVRVEDLIERVSSGKKYDTNTVSPIGAVPVLDQGRSGIIGYHDDEPGVMANEDEPIIVFANHTCYQRIIQFPFSAIQNVLPFLPASQNRRNIYWLHWATKDLVKFNDYKGHWPEFMSKRLLLPSADFCDEFGRIVKPMVQQIYKLDLKNANLRQTRDLLLPRLSVATLLLRSNT